MVGEIPRQPRPVQARARGRDGRRGPTGRGRAVTRGVLDGPGLVNLVMRGKADEVADRLAPLDEGQRKALAVDLVAFAKRHVPTWDRKANPGWAVTVAAIGCLPSAAQAGALIGRRNLSWQWLDELDSALVTRVARDRGIVWLGDLALRLTEKVDREFSGRSWAFLAEL